MFSLPNQQQKPTDNPTGRPFNSALKAALSQATSNLTGLAGLFVALAGLAASYWLVEEKLKLPQPWPALICVALLVLFVFVYVIPEWGDQRKLETLRLAGIGGTLKDSSFFRLTPYEQRDQATFKRPDKAGDDVRRWVEETKLPLLYLTGQSGAGKSSVINAALMPALAASGWVVVILRPHDDPLGAIGNGLLQSKEIWARPPANLAEPRAILASAAERVSRSRKRLLVVIDQFEEALILGADPAREQLGAFLQNLVQAPVPCLVVLLSLRAEYLNDLIDLSLPPPAYGPGRNAFEVRPFTRAAAQDFIQESGLGLGTRLLDDVLKEAAEIEDMPDRVRPIVLNLFGLVVSSFRCVLPKGVEAGRLLSGYVERSLARSASPGIAVRVLRPLVTDAGTKRTLTTLLVAEKARVSPQVARGCLIQLANDGLVRPLQVGEERWELSHDFVARLLQPVLRTWRESFWRAMRPWLIPTSLAVWLAMITGTAVVYPRLHEAYSLARLRSIGLVHGASTETGGITFVYNRTPFPDTEHFWRVARALEDLSEPVGSLDLVGARLTSLQGMPDLKSLTSLNLRDTPLASLQGMPDLKSLTSLDLSRTSLASLEGMPDLKSLTSLDLSNTPLTSLEGMPDLKSLFSLDLSSTRLASLEGMRDLKSLFSLDLSSTRLASLQGMPDLKSLTLLDLSSARLATLEGMRDLKSLTSLDLSGTRLVNLQGMRDLNSLTSLNLSNTPLASLEGMRDLNSLTALILSNTPLASLQGMHDLKSLTSLDLSNTPLTSLEGMRDLKSLTSLDLRSTLLPSLQGMPDLNSLTSLDLSNTPLTGLEGMRDLNSLTSLDLSNTPLTSLKGMRDLNSLTLLNLSNTPLTSLEGMRDLKELSALDARAKGLILSSANHLRNVKFIALSTNFNENSVHISKLPNIRKVFLSDRSVEINKIETNLAKKIEFIYDNNRLDDIIATNNK